MSSGIPATASGPTQAALEQAIARGQMSAALGLLRGLTVAADPPLSVDAARELATRLRAANWSAAAEPVVTQALDADDVQPWVGGLWSRLQLDLGRWDAFKQLRRLLLKGPPGEVATIEWIQTLEDHGQGRQVLRLASVGEHWIRASTPAWGAMTAALRRLRVEREGHFWTWCWQELPQLTARDLLQVSEILRANQRDAEGAEANRTALERHPADPLCGEHQCWLAADEVAAGGFAAAQQRLQGIDPARFEPDQHWLYVLVTAAVSVAAADPSRRPEVLTDARHSVDAACRAYPQWRSDAARRRLLQTVAAEWSAQGGVAARLWAAWRRWRS